MRDNFKDNKKGKRRKKKNLSNGKMKGGYSPHSSQTCFESHVY
jgi:hypothetical protein